MNQISRFLITITGVILVVLLISACSTAGTTADREDDRMEQGEGYQIEIDNPDLSLLDYLRRIPGLQFSDSGGVTNIRLRGVSTFSGDNSPLFVLDQIQLGNQFSQLEQSVSVADIESVSVLRSSEAMQQYGMRAANGAIVVRTKR
ncbi:MAG: TonB-dependent receptor plug domain-containing protein [Balneolaceae bacterium]